MQTVEMGVDHRNDEILASKARPLDSGEAEVVSLVEGCQVQRSSFRQAVEAVTVESYRPSEDDLVRTREAFLGAFPEQAESIRRLAELNGFVVVDTGPCEYFCDASLDVTLATGALSVLGRPIQPYQRANLWKPLGVDLEAGSGKATATDFIPLHIDLVNAAWPPDYSCLLAERPDPMGGGESIVSDFGTAIDQLDADDIAGLREEVLIEGEFYDIEEVGGEYNPVAVVRDEDDYIRFTAKWSRLMGTHVADAAQVNLNQALLRSAVRFLIEEGHLLIVDQRRVAHGRLTLGDDQEALLSKDRRVVMQSFARDW